ncbi:MAG TPA: hypothetical protein VD928_00795 [Candidatus Paceibacterota bacterium]|nr:hypothetical protein [Candidatus Paceibacterota bacterium]
MPGNNLQSLIIFAGNTLNMLIPVLIALALVVFFWGLIVYIFKKDPATGRQVMIAGLVALFIMVSVWGIIRLAQNTLGIQAGGAIPAPQVPQYDN